MQNTEMSIREKEKIMRDFIVQTVEYYRKKVFFLLYRIYKCKNLEISKLNVFESS